MNLRAATSFQGYALAQSPVDGAGHIVLGAISGEQINGLLNGGVQVDTRPMAVGALELVWRHFHIRHSAHINAMHRSRRRPRQ